MLNDNLQIHKSHRNRMKNIFMEHGFSAFSEIQKLEFLLFFSIPQKDVNPIAHSLLNEYGSIAKVLSASPYDLLKIKGVGKHTALLFSTMKEVVNECSSSKCNDTKLSNTSIAKEYCYNLMRHASIEEFYVICLDDNNKIIKTKKLNSGTTNRVNIEISSLTKLAFSQNATKIIIAHNHPSGNLAFSDDDIHLTHSVVCSSLLNDILVVDHILVTNSGSISLAENDIMSAIINAALNKLNIKRNSASYSSSPTKQYKVIKN